MEKGEVFAVPKILDPRYQVPAVDAIFKYFEDGNTGNPVCAVAVGGGKTLLMAEVIKRAHQIDPNVKLQVLNDNAKVLEQNEAELREHWPFLTTSFYCAKMKKKRLHGDVVFASIQSIANKADKLKHLPDLILVDEAHCISHNENTQYRKYLSAVKALNPYVKVIGFSGTPFRSDGGYLHQGKTRLFTDIVYDVSILDLISYGRLCEPITPAVLTKMDTSGVGTRQGDYITSALSNAVNTNEITASCVNEMLQYKDTRHKWLVFTVDKAHCLSVYEAIKASGVTCRYINSDISDDEQIEIIRAYRAGEYQCLVNVAMLSTGFNVTDIDLIAWMRPTKSPVLYIQGIGRGLRADPRKENLLFLDFGGVVDELGPVDKVQIKEKYESNGEGEPPSKVCPKCYDIVFAGVRACPSCGHEFPIVPKISKISSDAPILSIHKAEPRWYDVTDVKYARHKKQGKPDSMVATYQCGLAQFRDWICFEHDTIRYKAVNWWRLNADGEPPKTVTEALERVSEIRRPERIGAIKDGKYYKVTGLNYDKRSVDDGETGACGQ